MRSPSVLTTSGSSTPAPWMLVPENSSPPPVSPLASPSFWANPGTGAEVAAQFDSSATSVKSPSIIVISSTGIGPKKGPPPLLPKP